MRTATPPITFRWTNYMYCFFFLADLDDERIVLTRNKTGIGKEVLFLVFM